MDKISEEDVTKMAYKIGDLEIALGKERKKLSEAEGKLEEIRAKISNVEFYRWLQENCKDTGHNSREKIIKKLIELSQKEG